MNDSIKTVLIQLIFPIAAIFLAIYLFNTCMGDVPDEDYDNGQVINGFQ